MMVNTVVTEIGCEIGRHWYLCLVSHLSSTALKAACVCVIVVIVTNSNSTRLLCESTVLPATLT